MTTKDYIEVPEPPISAILSDTPFQQQKSVDKPDDSVSANGTRRTSERKKRVKMADLRTLIETKILSKSDRGLEKIGENGKRLGHGVRKFILYFFENISLICLKSLGYSSKFGHRR